MKIIRKHLLFVVQFLVSLPCLAQSDPKALVITIDANNTAQTIDNMGASGCWFSEGIGKSWPIEKKEKIAELLFSRQSDAAGNPKGIGLSAWRFNIGGGTAEQGDSSGIPDPRKRVECFLNPDGSYNWQKQKGYQWFLYKAKEYGVENLIAFSNTPPVQFTENGRGYKTVKDHRSNLKPEKYNAYADFLTEVIKHFDKHGLHFNYISPVNEPQWDWWYKPGLAEQEGSSWSNMEIDRIVSVLDSSVERKKLTTRILATEAGMLTYLYDGNSSSSQQVQQLYGNGEQNSFVKLNHVAKCIAGHSYYTDSGDSSMISVRRKLANTVQKYGIDFWQSEYSMLGDGFREGTGRKRSQLDCALFLAKMIHHDLTVGNAAAWQFWNSYEPGNTLYDTRYFLIALHPDKDYTDGEFTATKNLWAMGNYSLFVRPGMKRLCTSRSDGLDDVKAAQDVMISAFAGGKDKLVMVAVNYTDKERLIEPGLKNFTSVKMYRTYVTDSSENGNLRAGREQSLKSAIRLLPRSVTTIVFN